MSYAQTVSRWTTGLTLLGLLSGCGQDTGPQRYEVSGSVTYEGKPVLKGFVYFSPDTEQGNKGPGGGAPIDQGKFKTERGKGVVGGPHVIRVVGYDGVAAVVEGEQLTDGKPLFIPYFMKVDFPKKDHVLDIPVPQGGGKLSESVTPSAATSTGP